MITEPYNQNTEIDSLIFALLDNHISAEDHSKLQQILVADPASRARYRELSQLHSLLEEQAEGKLDITQEGHQSVISLPLVLQRQRRKIIRYALTSAAALVILSFTILYFIQIDSPMAKLSYSEYTEYQITYPSGSDEDIKKDSLVPGSSIEVNQGTLKLELASGVTAIIQSPSLITLTAENKVTLHQGKAWFNVSPEATGFTVITPQLEIVDLGTEFGVTVNPSSAQEEVHVFKGKVEVHSLHKFKQTKTLTTRQSCSVLNDGRLQDIVTNEAQYLKTLPPTLPLLSWDFNSLSQKEFIPKHTAISGNYKSKITNGDIRQTIGKEGNAASFTLNSGYLKTNWQGVDSDRPRTIVCWIKCPKHSPSGSIIEWGIPLSNSAKWRITLNPEQQNEGGIQGALRTEFGNGYIIGSTDLRDNKWHQIISIYDGSGIGNKGSIQLYVDGQKETISSYLENEIQTILSAPNSEPVSIGKKFVGKIDNLRIFQGVMPAEAFADEL